MPPAPLELPVGTSSARAGTLRRWLTGTLAGRALVVGALLKLLAFLLGAVWPGPVETLDTIGDVSLVAGAAVLAYRLFVDLKRRVLWRVRRKLTLSYIFIGFVPALLIIAFFIISGLLLFFNIASYLTRSQVEALVDRARFLADAAALDLRTIQDARGGAAALAVNREKVAAGSPAASFVLLPRTGRCGSPARQAPGGAVAEGPWSHAEPPSAIPAWIPCAGYQGLVPYTSGDRTRLAARAVAWVNGSDAAVVVDIPLGEPFVRDLNAQTGITLGNITALGSGDAGAAPRVIRIEPLGTVQGDAGGLLGWVAFLDYVRWDTGESDTLMMSFRVRLRTLYERISVSSVRGIGDFNVGQVLLVSLAIVGALFFVILAVAFFMGLGLARSITGSVHELFAGTERVRRGDWSHKIPIRSRDQLGELAQSFNEMTDSIDDLLRQKAEKERLEQELLIARNIQMSLLPQGAFSMTGLALTAHCEPAREVGGDYYDYLPIDGDRLGILIADVSGKGTSAALYMAELKGVVLSLSRVHASPRDLLIDANRIISRHLDARSFITATYAVVDLRARTLRYARAGHCPLIYMPGRHASLRQAQILAPDGMVVGLQLDEGEMFDRLLEEATLPLGPGDLFVLYTDGITEAMNPDGDIFGDDRLASLVSAHANLPSDQLRERILRDIRAFAGSAVQQDDMTMVLLRMDDVGALA